MVQVTPTRAAIENEPLRLRLQRHLRVTPAVFEKIARDNDTWNLELEADGTLLVREPTGAEGGHREGELFGRIWQWARADGRGVAFGPSSGFTLPGGGVRAPDAAWIERARWEALSRSERESFAAVVPDFVVELASPSDSRRWLREKMDEWIAAGARLGWLVDPREGTVSVHRPGRKPEVHPTLRPLSGEPEMPGLLVDFDGIA